MFYVQYNESGVITGTVTSEERPNHPHQLEFEQSQSIFKKVVVEGELVDAPSVPEEIDPEDLEPSYDI